MCAPRRVTTKAAVPRAAGCAGRTGRAGCRSCRSLGSFGRTGFADSVRVEALLVGEILESDLFQKRSDKYGYTYTTSKPNANRTPCTDG